MWHNFWLWVYYNAQTIQAACAFLGVLGLAVYAIDTRKIRQATLAQSEASRRPAFVLDQEENTVHFLRNVGTGIAIDVKVRFLDQISAKSDLAVMVAIGDRTRLDHPGPDGLAEAGAHLRREGLYVTFADTAGKRYWQKWVPSGRGYMFITTGEL